MQKSTLSIQDTNVLKGVAIMLMLWHHLFWRKNGLYTDLSIGNCEIVNYTGILTKVCVSIFVFLSGYGLTIQVIQKGSIDSLKNFYRYRFSKLYLNYWLIWILFVPIGVFVFHHSLSACYQSHIIAKFSLDILGIINCFGFYGYNETWWFYSCIILLYLLFPLLYQISKRNTIYALLTAISTSYLPFNLIVKPIKIYVIIFVVGIIYAQKDLLSKSTLPKLYWVMLAFLLLFERNKVGIIIDAAIVVVLAHLYTLFHLPHMIRILLSFLGKHSMNIFLFHTFIFSQWFRHIIYSLTKKSYYHISLFIICLCDYFCHHRKNKRYHSFQQTNQLL